MAVYEMSALALGRAIHERRISAPEALTELLRRLHQTEDAIHAYLTLDVEGAMHRAKLVQERIDRGETNSSLAGVPIALKDNICVNGMKTTCASRMLADFIPPYSATAVEKLLENDMVLYGKLNMDEFAMGSTTETSYFGITVNPWGKDRVPGGSSGGAAAAVAVGSAFCALGSDTGGSIRQPASHCGVTGFKPTYGTVSRYGLIAYASSLEQIGPIGRDAADCAALMDIIRGVDARDSTSCPSTSKPYAACLENNVRGLRIAVPVECLEGAISLDVARCVERMARELEKMGAVVSKINFPLMKYAVSAYYTIATAEAASNLSRYDGIKYGYRADGDMPLSEVYTRSRSEGFGSEVKRRIILGNFVLSAGYYDAYYRRALQAKAAIKAYFEDVFRDYDLLLMPTAPTTAPRIGTSLDDVAGMYSTDCYTVPANLAGLPALTLPCGFGTDGLSLPIGAQLIGAAFTDARVLSVGFAYQQMTDYHTKRPWEVSVP